jgi:hypothetical protein
MAKPRQNKLFGATKLVNPKKKRLPKTQLQEEKRMDERVLRQSGPEIEDLKKLTPMEKYHKKRTAKMAM